MNKDLKTIHQGNSEQKTKDEIIINSALNNIPANFERNKT